MKDGVEVDPVDYAKAYHRISLAAANNGLTLVSPTVRAGYGVKTETSDDDPPVVTSTPQEADWFGRFVVACLESAASTGCDIDLIKVFDLHWYRCDDDASWNDPAVERDHTSNAQGTPVGGIFAQTREDLVKSIMHHDTDMAGWGRNEHYWREWVNDRPFWVSETSCEWDKESRDDHSNVVSCQKQTGQYSHNGAVAGAEHGEGSIAGVLDPSQSVGRWSWWTTQRLGTETTTLEGGLSVRLCDQNSALTPMGNAWLDPGSSLSLIHI